MRKLVLPICYMVTLTFFVSCIASNMSFGNGKDWIPPEFDPKTSILMILETSHGQDKKMEDYLKKNYPYRYELVRYQDVMDREGKFADAALYRFVLMGANTSVQRTDNGGAVSAHDFYFYDRYRDKKFPATGKGSFSSMTTFKPIINTLAKWNR